LYRPSAKDVAEVDVPEMHFLMIDGQGDPNTSQAYADAVEALFALSYAIKFHVKKGELAIDYGVMPLEGLWWADNLKDFENDNRDNLKWTMMILQPKWVTQPVVKEAIEQARKKSDNPCLYKLRLENVEEGLCGQILHIGPFLEEHATILKLHKFISDQKGQFDGKVQKHHEIYLSDIRRVAPEKYRTIIRQPYTQ